MEFLVIIFFFGLSAGTVAKIKGGSFLLWFLIGFCLPFLGTVAAVLHRSDRDELKQRCPTCGTVMPLYQQVCMRCGEDLFPREDLEPEASPLEPKASPRPGG
jgi:hypothetical protein